MIMVSVLLAVSLTAFSGPCLQFAFAPSLALLLLGLLILFLAGFDLLSCQ
jgi:hypothetical protein